MINKNKNNIIIYENLSEYNTTSPNLDPIQNVFTTINSITIDYIFIINCITHII